MKKKQIKYFFMFILFFIIIIHSNKIFASIDEGYEIQTYNVDMIVNKNNSLDITETIKVYFNEPRHGIIKDIPIYNKVKRNDKTISINFAKISNLTVSEDYTISSDFKNKYIKFGNSNEMLTGEHTYIIKYNYYIGRDSVKNADELYFNIIGDNWDTTIDRVDFKITMPKEFNPEKLGFSEGYRDSLYNSNVKFNVDGNVITGYTLSRLNAGQALTVRLTLPDRYFVNFWTYIEMWYDKIVIAICIIVIIKAYMIWLKYGKDDKTIETVEFYPPEGYNSAEIGYLYYGKPTNESIISLLVYFASKGYIKIEEIEEGVFKRKTYRIVKLKEYNGPNPVEQKFFKGLFLNGEPDMKEITEKFGENIPKQEIERLKRTGHIKCVKEKNLRKNFYKTINEIKDYFNEKSYKAEIIRENSIKREKNINFMMGIVFYLISFKMFFDYQGIITAIIKSVVLKFFISILADTIIFDKRPINRKIIQILIEGAIVVVISKFIVVPALVVVKSNMFMYIVGILTIALLLLFDAIMPKRTQYGTEMLGKIKGFRRFLETAEKSQLEALVEENPEYFYNILPYTYALGVSTVWMKQFESMAIEPPIWFDNSIDKFDYRDFDRFFYDTMNSVTTVSKRIQPKEFIDNPSDNWSPSSSMSSSSSSSSSSSDRTSSSTGGGSAGNGSGGRRSKIMVIYYK